MSFLNIELFYVLSYVPHLYTLTKKKKNQNGGWSVLIVNDGIESSRGGEPISGLSSHTSECWHIVSALLCIKWYVLVIEWNQPILKEKI